MAEQGRRGQARRWVRTLAEVDRSAGFIAGLRRVRRALPGDPGFGDPLSTAGSDSAGTVARVADRLFDEQPRASRELGLGALQVWTALLERAGRGQGDQELALLFTDLVGFSSWALRVGDDLTLRLLREVATAVEPPVLAHRGRIVKRLGDGLMAVFPTSQLGFDAVTDMRERLAAVEVEGYRPTIRAGLHTGRPRALGGDYLGVDVNIAARIADRAGGGELLVSAGALAALDLDRVEVRRKRSFGRRGKGVPDDLVIYAAWPR